jgi:hypothetical protein
MAKKSKRQPARKQARQQQRPRPVSPRGDAAGAMGGELVPGGAGLDLDDDHATGSLPVPESDGPMPLPPAETDEDAEYGADDGEEEATQPPAAAAMAAASSSPSTSATAAGTPAARPRVAAATATDASGRRRVGRIDPNAAAAPAALRPGQRGRPGRTTATAAMFEPLPPEEAAIPFDRVPYVPGDLRRVLVIAALMVVLVVAADFVVNAVVK